MLEPLFHRDHARTLLVKHLEQLRVNLRSAAKHCQVISPIPRRVWWAEVTTKRRSFKPPYPEVLYRELPFSDMRNHKRKNWKATVTPLIIKVCLGHSGCLSMKYKTVHLFMTIHFIGLIFLIY